MKRKKVVESSGRKSLRFRGTQCLNCGQSLDKSDVYCPYCSQLNSNKQLSVNDFFAEFLSSILVYDSRLRNTLKDLLLRPGIMTLNYVKGQRLKYANPFRFFLSVSIIYFIIQGLIGLVDPSEGGNLINLKNENNTEFNMDSLQKVLKNENIDPAVANNLYYNLDSIKLKKKPDSIHFISEASLDTMSFTNRFIKRFELYGDFYDAKKIKNPSQALDSLHHRNTRFNRWVYSKNITWEKITDNPAAFMSYTMSKIPFFLFFFTPFFALFFWILYYKKEYTYMEHMIFIFHIFSFVFLAMLIFLLPDLILDGQFFIGLLFLVIGPFYFYKALRKFYKQNRVMTLIKFVFLSTVFIAGLSMAAILFVAVSAAIY